MKPTLDEIFGSPSAASKPSLDEIFNGSASITPAVPTEQPGFFTKVGRGLKSFAGGLISSEKGFGEDIAGALSGVLPESATGIDKIRQANQAKQQSANDLIKRIGENRIAGKDNTLLRKALSDLTGQEITTDEDLYPALKKSNLQVLGDAAGVLLDIASAGTYGTAAKGAKTGQLLTKADKVAEATRAAEVATTAATVAKTIETGSKFGKGVIPVTAEVAKKGLGETLKTIAKQTAKRAGIGTVAGYGYDVSENLKSGAEGGDIFKPGAGTVLGGSIPLVIGGIRATSAITKDVAPRLVNSLIKPKAADFSYGKDPGRTVADLGITGNSLPDFADNIGTAKRDIGQTIGDIYKSPANSSLQLDFTDEISKIDDAMAEAAKGGKNNQGIVTQLQNIKDSLLFEHAIDGDGNIVKKGSEALIDLSKLTPEEAFSLKKEVAARTQFTGRPSDDKTVNSVLQNIYGSIKEKLNNAVGKNNPEILDLNQKYADLTSAELATRNRDKIIQRSNVLSLGSKITGGTSALVAAITTGGAAIPVILAGTTGALLEKAFETTAVKTRVASWLGSQKPSVVRKLIEQNPGIREVLYRTWPKLASELRQD